MPYSRKRFIYDNTPEAKAHNAKSWRCKTCVWSGLVHKRNGVSVVFCRAWDKYFNANDDRYCYEEPLDHMRRRIAAKRPRRPDVVSSATTGANKIMEDTLKGKEQ